MNHPQREQSRERVRRHKSDTIQAVGLRKHLGSRYDEFAWMIDGGESDNAIAQVFSTEERKYTYQTVSNWRKHYVLKHIEPGVK